MNPPPLTDAAPAALVLGLTNAIDRLTLRVGQTVRWFTLAIPVICFAYAVIRKLFDWGHNGLSELQWYLFAMVYLLAAGYTLLMGQHVRVDFFWRRFGIGTRCAIDLAFLVPLVAICVYMAAYFWDFWLVSLRQRETPEDVVVGLERWPIKLALFLGFALLGLQCLGESLKRMALLRAWLPASAVYADETPPLGRPQA